MTVEILYKKYINYVSPTKQNTITLYMKVIWHLSLSLKSIYVNLFY